ncbi:MAG: DUF6489 family protein [Sphingopyxis sp.]
MKITITIDCTPVEARSFFGLPDVSPLHETYVRQMESAMDHASTDSHGAAASVGDMVRRWSGMGDAGMAMAQTLMSQMASAATQGQNGRTSREDGHQDGDKA